MIGRIFPPWELFHYGAFRAEYPFRLLRIWQTAAHDVLDADRPSMLAWLPLLATSEQEFVEATHRLQRSPDPEAVTMFRILGELRYGKDVWQRVLQRGFRMIPDELLEQSTFLGEWKQRGILIGRQEGTHVEAVRIAGGMLIRRFPALASRADSLESVTDLKKLEDLIYALPFAVDQEAALRLLDDAIR